MRMSCDWGRDAIDIVVVVVAIPISELLLVRVRICRGHFLASDV